MNKVKRISIIAVLMAIAVILSSCSNLDGSGIMCPPKATGSKAEIQELIDEQTSGEYTLKYPKSGTSRSSIVMCDVDCDDEQEAVAFYTTADSKIHMLFVQCEDNDYTVADDIICTGTDIDLVGFADIDGDKNKEVLIGYSMSSVAQNTLTVYRFKDKVSPLDTAVSYSSIVTGDFNYDNHDDILLLSLYSGDSPAQAQLMVYSGNNSLSEMGSVELDSDITGYAQTSYTMISEGTYGAVIDGINSADEYTTQLIYYDPSQPLLVNPLYVYSGYSLTKRSTQICSDDIDSDDVIEIPLCSQMGYSSSEDVNTVSRQVDWSKFDKDSVSLNTVSSAIMCIPDRYMLYLPSKWVGTVTARYIQNSRETIVYVWEYVDGVLQKSTKLLTVKAFTKDEFDKDSEGYVELSTNGSTVYAYMIHSSDHYLAITGEEVISMFSPETNM